MPDRRHLTAAVLSLAALATPAMAAQPCGAGAICGMKDAEDIVRVGASRWALASHLVPDPTAPGGFYLVDLQGRRAVGLAPDFAGPVAPAYADCPGPPAPASLLTHGLDLRLRPDGGGELYAVNHGGRQSIEVFDLRLRRDGVALAWKGCIIVPPEVSANAVAALPDGFAVTSFGEKTDKDAAELLAGRPSGFVVTWSHAKGWRRVPDSRFAGDNGVVASADGRTLYVNGWGDGTLHILDLGHGAGAPVTVRLGDLHPDNLHAAADGRLVVAGQVGTIAAIWDCAEGKPCTAGSGVATFDPRTRAVHAELTVPATADFAAASTAVPVDGGYWLSSFRGDRIVRARAAAAPR